MVVLLRIFTSKATAAPAVAFLVSPPTRHQAALRAAAITRRPTEAAFS